MDELRGQVLWESPWFDYTGPLQERIRNAVEKAAQGTVENITASYTAPDGAELETLIAIIPVENDRDEVEYLVFEGRNISAEIRLRDELEQQRDFLDSIINAAPQGIFVKTSDGEYVLANDTVSKVLGVAPEEIRGKTDFELIDRETAEKFREDDLKVLRQSESIQYEERLFHAAHEEHRTFLTVKTPIFENRPREEKFILGITTDISKRKRLQQELEEQKNFLQTILNSAPNFIFVKDWNGVFREANATLANFYGTQPEELIGKTDDDFNPELEEVESFHEADREVMRTGEALEIPEEPVTNPTTGETHWFQTTKVPLHTEQPVEERQVLGVSTEITEKKEIRENLEESLREKETLLGEIHHRVKNNLQIIQSMLRMEKRSGNENPALQDCINRINSMALLHEKLYQSEKLNEIDLSSYFEELARHLKGAVGTETSGIRIDFSVDLDSIPIQDAVSCGLVVNELITNSLQHGFGSDDVGRIDVSLQRTDDGYEITVEDDGDGLPEGTDITSIESTGIRIIRSIVEYEYDGEITFDRDDGLLVRALLIPEHDTN